ncbi:MAG TPA: HD domain-containing protein [Blastocatellia bacterium]|nr:HD domain-containing protein [Blastocatellia bacterium]
MDDRVISICRAVRDAGGRAMLVGGWVRDHFAGIESKDYDIEVYGVESRRLRSILEKIARVNTVGESFTVYKLTFDSIPAPPSRKPITAEGRIEIDVSVPRRESKSGRGHRGFTVEGDPSMSFEDAALRRDFTINSILYDPLDDQTIDPFSGLADLDRRILRVVSADTFIEDSLRVLRGMQLSARYELAIDSATAQLCRGIDLSDLPHERIWGEFEKLLTLAKRPSIGLATALEFGVLDKLFAEIRALAGCHQDAEEHPEGDAFEHTKLCLDIATNLAGSLSHAQRITLLLAVICHDLGKPLTTTVTAGRVTFPNHDAAGVEPARSVLDRLGLHTLGGYDVRSRVLELVREHLQPSRLYAEREKITDGAIRRVSREVAPRLLCLLARADGLARGPASSDDAAEWLIDKFRSLGVEEGPPEPILMGRHLLEAGFPPGPEMGELIRRVYELQLDGEVRDVEQGLAAAQRLAQSDQLERA